MNASDRIVLVGQGYWAEQLAEGLQLYEGLETSVVALDHVGDAASLAPWIQLARARVLVRIGFRPGARTVRGLAFDWLLELVGLFPPRKIEACYWIGTDARLASRDVHEGVATRRFRRLAHRLRHFAGSSWVASELAAIGINAETVDFPWTGMPDGIDPPPMPTQFTVLTYMRDSKPEEFGASSVLAAARNLPDVRFLIMGAVGSWAVDPPHNVEFLGWQDDTAKWYAAASCVVRLKPHDSIGGTAVEGLGYGRPVIYTQPLEDTIQVTYGDQAGFEAVLRVLYERHRRGELKPDTETARRLQERWSAERLYADVAAALRRLTAAGD